MGAMIHPMHFCFCVKVCVIHLEQRSNNVEVALGKMYETTTGGDLENGPPAPYNSTKGKWEQKYMYHNIYSIGKNGTKFQ
jgi:hypothetical protein